MSEKQPLIQPTLKKNKFSSKYVEFYVTRQLEISTFVLCCMTAAYYLEVPYAKYLFEIQGELPDGRYVKHILDTFYVFFWTVFFIMFRAFFTEKVFEPIGKYNGIKDELTLSKFKEQSLLVLFYCLSWGLGFYIYTKVDYFFDFEAIWRGYPNKIYLPLFKKYFLGQMGFWASQFYFIQIEFKRKDHLMMCVHHVITFTLLVTGYYTNYSAFGHVILMLMDMPDIFLSLAKSLKYIGYKMICDVIFVIFFISWIVNRHILFGYLLYSVAVHPLNYRDIEWNPAEGVYFTRPIQVFFLVVMGSLEILIIMWFRMILKIVISVLNGANADDIRSDDEEEEEVEEVEEVEEKTEPVPIKEKVSSPKGSPKTALKKE